MHHYRRVAFESQCAAILFVSFLFLAGQAYLLTLVKQWMDYQTTGDPLADQRALLGTMVEQATSFADRRRSLMEAEVVLKEDVLPPWLASSSASPRKYAMDRIYSTYEEYGIGPEPRQAIESLLKRELCAATLATSIYGKEAHSAHSATLRCLQDLDKKKRMAKALIMRKCATHSTASGSIWFSVALPSMGAAFVLVNGDSKNLQAEAVSVIDTNDFQSIDFLVPFKLPKPKNGKDDEANQLAMSSLLKLALSIREAIRGMRKSGGFGSSGGDGGREIQCRVIVSQWQEDTWVFSDPDFAAELGQAARNLQLVPAPYHSKAADFQRAHVANHLLEGYACQDANCLVALMDVDMRVSRSFLYNSVIYTKASHAAYFPIVYSKFNPQLVELVQSTLESDEELATLSTIQKEDHQGHWRPYGSGMWSMAGSDAKRFRFNENFTTWGGEDNDFLSKVSASLNIVRAKDEGLVHDWHPKNCDPAMRTKDPAMFKSCEGSLIRNDGSLFGRHLAKSLSRRSRSSVVSATPTRPKKEPLAMTAPAIRVGRAHLRRPQATGSKEAIATTVQKDLSGTAPTQVRVREDETPRHAPPRQILIVVEAGPSFLREGLSVIAKTWASNLPPQVTVWFMVPEHDATAALEENTSTGDLLPRQSVLHGFKAANSTKSSIIYQRAALLQYVSKQLEEEGTLPLWILKVNDQTYVNILGLTRFVSDKSASDRLGLWGHLGSGAGLHLPSVKALGYSGPYCEDAQGILMTGETLKQQVSGLETCLNYMKKPTRGKILTFPDLATGICFSWGAKLTCNQGKKDGSATKFIDRRSKKGAKLLSSDDFVTVYPFEYASSMLLFHDRFNNETTKSL